MSLGPSADNIAEVPTSPGERAWALPHVQVAVLLYLPQKDIHTLLIVSRAHFRSAVAVLYEKFHFDKYREYVPRWTDEQRKKLYLNAVRRVEISWKEEREPWYARPTYLHPFPSATSVVGERDSAPLLDRDLMNHPTTYCLRHRHLWSYPQPYSYCNDREERGMSLPPGWTEITPMSFSISDSVGQNMSKQRYTSLEQLFADLPSTGCVVESLDISCKTSNGPSLYSVSKCHTSGDKRLNLQSLSVGQVRSDDLSVISNLGSGLKYLNLYNDLHNWSKCSVHLDHFLREFDPSRFLRLRELQVGLTGPTSIDRTLRTPAMDVCDRSQFPRCATPGRGLEWLIFDIVYPHPLKMSPIEIENEKKSIIRLAELLMPLVDPYAPPSVVFSCCSREDIATHPASYTLYVDGCYGFRETFYQEMTRLIRLAVNRGRIPNTQDDTFPVTLTSKSEESDPRGYSLRAQHGLCTSLFLICYIHISFKIGKWLGVA